MTSLRVLSLGLALLFAGGSVIEPPFVQAEAKVRAKKKAKPKAKAKAKKKKKKPAVAESQYKIRVEEAPNVYRFDASGEPITPKAKKAKFSSEPKTPALDEIDGIAPLDDAKTCGADACSSPKAAP